MNKTIYYLADNQGTLENKQFESKREVKEYLVSYHSADHNESYLKRLSLADLLDLGDWTLTV